MQLLRSGLILEPCSAVPARDHVWHITWGSMTYCFRASLRRAVPYRLVVLLLLLQFYVEKVNVNVASLRGLVRVIVCSDV
jgi:hypothetical protein